MPDFVDSVLVGDESGGSVGNRSFTNKRVNVLLDESNFLIWRQQVLLTVRSHRLEKFLTGKVTAPPEKVRSTSGALVDNEAYEEFVAQDSALACWLLSTMSPHLLSNFVGAESAAQVWKIVVEFFNSRSTTTVMSLHFKLRSIRKGEMSMRAYISKVKEVCDALASCGSPVSITEQVASILNGLPVDYKPFVAVITASREPFTLDSVTNILVDAEAQQSLFDQFVPMVANNVQVSSGRSFDNSVQKSSSSNPGQNNRGRGRNRFQCQLCGKMGHLADRCYRRFDKSFSGVFATNQRSRGNDGSSSAHTCSPESNTPPPSCVPAGSTSGVANCNLCTQPGDSSEGWYLDTGATHHVSPDASGAQCSDFTGPVC